MSSSRANPSDGLPSNPQFSVFDMNPSSLPYTVVDHPRRDGTMGKGRSCDICLKIIGIGRKGSLHSYNLHVQACQRKQTLRAGRGSPDRARSLSVAPSTTAASTRSHESMSLSPRIIQSQLDTSRSPSPSPAHSPISFLTPQFFDGILDSVGRMTPASIQMPLELPSVSAGANPSISLNPPSDDLLSLPMSLYPPQSHQITSTPCSGVSVQWTPGTIWETYPFPSHSFVKHPWDIIEFRPPSHICLRSKGCTGSVTVGGYGNICHQCLRIPQCDAFKTIEKRAHNAPPHTPHHFLTFHQLADIPKLLRKMLDEARIKVINTTFI